MQPVLETSRLILRPPQHKDFDDIHAMWSDIDVVRHVTGVAFTREEAWARLLRSAGHWTLMGFGYWVISEKHTGKFLGETGFGQFKRGIDPSFDATPEIGWMLNSAAHGKGYGTEAAKAALQWSDARWPEGETVCIISPANEASLALANKCAFKLIRSDIYKGKPTLVLHRKANAERNQRAIT